MIGMFGTIGLFVRYMCVGVKFIACNTDAQALNRSLADHRVQLGMNLTHGLGAGARPEVGHASMEEALDELFDHLDGSHMVFLTGGMGGGTGTGAIPVIARALRSENILTVGVVTKPFSFEGKGRMRIADRGLVAVEDVLDTLIVIPNQNLLARIDPSTSLASAFKVADDVLYSGVRSISSVITTPGLINLDFADVRTVMRNMGRAMMGAGEAEGENRALEAAELAVCNPLLDNASLEGAVGVLVNVTGGDDMTLIEVEQAAERIRENVSEDANIIFGTTFDRSMTGKLRISVVATGIGGTARPQVPKKGPSEEGHAVQGQGQGGVPPDSAQGWWDQQSKPKGASPFLASW